MNSRVLCDIDSCPVRHEGKHGWVSHFASHILKVKFSTLGHILTFSKEIFYKPCVCDGSTPIQFALINKRFDVVIFLLYRLNRKRVFTLHDVYGRSFLQQVLASDHIETIERALCCYDGVFDLSQFVTNESGERYDLLLARSIAPFSHPSGLPNVMSLSFLSEEVQKRLVSYIPTEFQAAKMNEN